jgi:3-methyladenine DNA glycosylase AlkD
MDLATAMATLEAAGTEQNRKTYRRHGARDPMFGVSFAVMRPLAKRAKRDQALARELWGTGNYDARILACMVAYPASTTEQDLDAWLADIDVYTLVDIFVVSLAAQVPGVRARADRWTASDRDWTSQAGWDLYAQLALNDPSPDDAFFSGLLERIEAGIHGGGNRTRHSMNGALIAIGARNERLRADAEAASGRIGIVVVDHGETGCVTPAAVPYIAKIWDRKEAQAAKAARGAKEPVGAAV